MQLSVVKEKAYSREPEMFLVVYLMTLSVTQTV
jgi:hypothetical protein